MIKIITAMLMVSSFLVFTGCAPKRELRLFHTLDVNNTSVERSRLLASRRATYASGRYIIRPYDRLNVIVYEHPELGIPSQGVMVDGAGRVALPIVGRVHVAGLSESRAAQRIQSRMRQHLTDAIVTAEVPNKVVYVIGDVKKPGPVKLTTGKMRLLRAIASAGGLTDAANRDAVYLVREQHGRSKLIKLSLSGSGALANSFWVLRPNDILYVSPNDTKLIEMGPIKTLKFISEALSPFSTTKTLIQ